jgi:glycosyltransferase involved in cell wall biosynthesis
MKRKVDIYIGVDNLNAFVGIVLKFFGFINKVIFYVIDYTPERFDNKLLNILYYVLDIICAKYADYVWSVSERIANIWKTIGIKEQKNIIVPIGVEIEKVKRIPITNVRKNVLIYAGHLTKSKGVQLAIEAMEELVKIIPYIKLEIIGTGPFEEELKNMVRRKKLEKWVKFLGKMNHDELLQYLPTCGIALATYEPDPRNIAYYADPTKPKEYLACGVPVIITRVPWIAHEIARTPMGIVINYDKNELINAIIKLLFDEKFYQRCRENAINFATKFDWNKIFDEAFNIILQRENYE